MQNKQVQQRENNHMNSLIPSQKGGELPAAQTEYDSDTARREEEMRLIGEQIKVATAHVELLNFFAQCDDSEESENS